TRTRSRQRRSCTPSWRGLDQSQDIDCDVDWYAFDARLCTTIKRAVAHGRVRGGDRGAVTQLDMKLYTEPCPDSTRQVSLSATWCCFQAKYRLNLELINAMTGSELIGQLLL